MPMDRIATRAGSAMQEDGGQALGVAAFLQVDIMALTPPSQARVLSHRVIKVR